MTGQKWVRLAMDFEFLLRAYNKMCLAAVFPAIVFSVGTNSFGKEPPKLTDVRIIDAANGQVKEFFHTPPELWRKYDPDKIYPRGRVFMYSMYSVENRDDMAKMKRDGFTCIGPYYGVPGDGQGLDYARVSDLKFIARVGMDISWNDPKFVMPSDSEIREALTSQVKNLLRMNPAIVWWYLAPEELKNYRENEMHYLKVATQAIRAADPENRPIWMYKQNSNKASDIKDTSPFLDICGKGMYTNLTVGKIKRIYGRWSIEQEIEGAKGVNPDSVAIAVPEMHNDPEPQDQHLIDDWTRHDVYLALVTGAKGVVIWSGFRRNELRKNYDDYYEGYASVAREVNGPLSLGRVFLFGERRTDINVIVTSGPETVTVKPSFVETQVFPSVSFANIAYGPARYLFLVNSANASITVNVVGLPSQTVLRRDVFANSDFIESKGGSFSVNLDAFGVKCFYFSPKLLKWVD